MEKNVYDRIVSANNALIWIFKEAAFWLGMISFWQGDIQGAIISWLFYLVIRTKKIIKVW